jgi:Cu/Ag efflux protein CusF
VLGPLIAAAARHPGLLGMDRPARCQGRESDITLTFAEGKPEITAIDAISEKPGYVVKRVDAKAKTITVSFGKDGALEDLPVADKVYIYLYDKGNEGKLSDLDKDMRVAIQMGLVDGRLVVKDIRARK